MRVFVRYVVKRVYFGVRSRVDREVWSARRVVT